MRQFTDWSKNLPALLGVRSFRAPPLRPETPRHSMPKLPLADLIHDIDLRWALRDIKSNRTFLLASNQSSIDELLLRGWVEMQDGRLTVTKVGLDALDVY